MVKIPYIGIANLLLGRPMYPERIQGEATAEKLATELVDCLENAKRIEQTRTDSKELRGILDKPSGGGAGSWLVSKLKETD